jgi:hypothetical protein
MHANRPIALRDLQKCVEKALADPRPSAPARDVFKRLRDHHAAQMKAKRHESE